MCKIVKIDSDIAVKTCLLFLVLIFSSANICLVSESKISHFYDLTTERVLFSLYLSCHS